MAVRELTDKYVQGVKAPEGTQLNIRDKLVPGLILKVSAGRQTKQWSVEYHWPPAAPRADRKKIRRPLGLYPDVKLSEAREAAREVRRQAAKGIDPAAEPEPSTQLTVIDLVENYCRLHSDSKRTGPEIRRRLNKNVTALIGTVKLGELHRRDLTKCIDTVMARGKRTEAVRVFQDLRACIRWAARRGDLDSNLMSDQQLPAEVKPRERWLTADEVRHVWYALDAAKMTENARWCLRLALVTLQRIGEVSGIHIDELHDVEDEAAALWIIPAARHKSQREHRVPLSPLAVELIREQRARVAAYELRVGRTEVVPWLFPTPRGGPLRSGGLSHAVQQHGRNNGDGKTTMGIPHWTAHDLRRTGATHMEELGISPFIISHVLGHTSETKGGVTGRHYRQYTYDKEKRAALDLWAAKLREIVRGR